MSEENSKNNPTSTPKTKGASGERLFRHYWISIIGVVVYLVLDAVVQSLPPHYSWIRDAESDLAVGPYGYIMGINFVIRGLLSLSFIYAFIKTVDLSGGNRRSFRAGYYLLGGLWGVGAILLAFFPTDVPATPISWHGAIHLVVALFAFAGGALGTLVLSRHFAENEVTKGAKNIALMLGSFSTLLLVLELAIQFIFRRFALKYFGLAERMFLGSVLLWILVMSIYMVANKQKILLGNRVPLMRG